MQVEATGNARCRSAEGPDLKPACAASCDAACSASLDAFTAGEAARTGLALEPTDKGRLLKSCRRSCAYECMKSGKAHDFAAVYRK